VASPTWMVEALGATFCLLLRPVASPTCMVEAFKNAEIKKAESARGGRGRGGGWVPLHPVLLLERGEAQEKQQDNGTREGKKLAPKARVARSLRLRCKPSSIRLRQKHASTKVDAGKAWTGWVGACSDNAGCLEGVSRASPGSLRQPPLPPKEGT